jgi:hypothetical protein
VPSIYVLPQTFFTEKELDNAEKKSMPAIFAKEGFNRNTSRVVWLGMKLCVLVGGGSVES